MIVSFELTMPGVASWNNKWSGEGKKYFKHRKILVSHPIAKALMEVPDIQHTYRWEDGWMAKVTLRRIDSKTKTKEAKQSAGFCGYEWMIDSILRHNKIIIQDNALTY
jgi:hypothetical protein